MSSLRSLPLSVPSRSTTRSVSSPPTVPITSFSFSWSMPKAIAGRVPHLGLYDRQVPREIDADNLATHVVAHEGIRGDVDRRVHRVDVVTVLIRYSGDTEELQVTREGCLRHVDALPLEPLQELLLAVDLFRVEDVVDQTASRFLTFQISPPCASLLVLAGIARGIFMRDAN